MKSHFTKLIKAGERLREFNFRKLSSANENLFHVDVSDDRGNRIVFRMQKEDGQWKIMNEDVAGWITHVEPELHTAIEE